MAEQLRDIIADCHNEADHHRWTRYILAKVLLGHGEIWDHEDFIKFSEGFRLEYAQQSQFIKVCSSLCDFDTLPKGHLWLFSLQEFDHVRSLRDVSTPAEKTALVASLYNRRISDPSCLFPRFEYELTFMSATPCSEAVNASVNVFYDSLKLSVSRYLRGRGHPNLSGVHAIVHPSDIQNHRESLSLRSILLMLSVHGFETRPIIPASWKIRVRCFAAIALHRSHSLFEV